MVKFASDLTEARAEKERARIREEKERAEWLEAQVGGILEVVEAAGKGDLTRTFDQVGIDGPVGALASGGGGATSFLGFIIRQTMIESATPPITARIGMRGLRGCWSTN